MPAHVSSFALLGIDAVPVEVHVDEVAGTQPLHITGLEEHVAREMAVRVIVALHRVGVDTRRGFRVELVGADAAFERFREDAAVAAALLVHTGRVPPELLDGLLVGGELGLDGSIRTGRGAACAALLARDHGLRGLLLPVDSTTDAAAITDAPAVWSVANVGQLVRGELDVPTGDPAAAEPPAPDMHDLPVSLTPVVRALAIAAVGRHNLLLEGPPGVGATMVTRRLPTILPPLSTAELDAVAAAYSAAGLPVPRQPPLRAPHHSISEAGLMGGGHGVRPGELSLAHGGVLFLDELQDFRRATLDALRDALQRGYVERVHRGRLVRLPARPAVVVASVRSCPCGWRGSRHQSPRCTCSPDAVQRFGDRLRAMTQGMFALRVTPAGIDTTTTERCESSAILRDRVQQAGALRTALSSSLPHGQAERDALLDIARSIAALAGMSTVAPRIRAAAASYLYTA